MIVQVVPEHENAGKIVLAPIVFPCVLEVAGSELKLTKYANVFIICTNHQREKLS